MLTSYSVASQGLGGGVLPIMAYKESAHLGQWRILSGRSFLRGKFDSWPVFRCFRKLKKMATSVKTMRLLAFFLVLLSRSEVEKTFRADSFPNGSEASCRGTTHNSHKLQVRVERA